MTMWPFPSDRVDRHGAVGDSALAASSVPDSSMSFGFAENCITTRGRVSSIVIPNCAAICRSCAISSAGGRSPRPDGACWGCVSASNG